MCPALCFAAAYLRFGLRKPPQGIDRKLCDRMQTTFSFHTIAPTKSVRKLQKA